MDFSSSTLKAVEELGYSLTAGDLVIRNGLEDFDILNISGVDFATARRELIELANASVGKLKVDKEGEIVFIFPTNVRNVIRAKNFRYSFNSLSQLVFGFEIFSIDCGIPFSSSFGLHLDC